MMQSYMARSRRDNRTNNNISRPLKTAEAACRRLHATARRPSFITQASALASAFSKRSNNSLSSASVMTVGGQKPMLFAHCLHDRTLILCEFRRTRANALLGIEAALRLVVCDELDAAHQAIGGG